MDRGKASKSEDWSPLGPGICKSIPTLKVARQRAVLYKLIPLSPRKLSLPARKLPPALHWGGGGGILRSFAAAPTMPTVKAAFQSLIHDH